MKRLSWLSARGITEAAAFLLRWGGAALLVRRLTARRVAILMYHDPSPAVLERHLRYLSRRYTFVSLSDLAEALHSGGWNLPRHALAITLDDGLRGNQRLVSLFREYGVRPTLFVCSGSLADDGRLWFRRPHALPLEALKRLPNSERLALLHGGVATTTGTEAEERDTLDRTELEGLSASFEIGSHTRTHPILTTCGDVESATEITDSRRDLEGMLGLTCEHFSFPNGDYGPRELELVRRAGYRSARTTDVGWNGAGGDPYRIKILGTRDDASVNRLAADLSGVLPFLVRALGGAFDGRKRPIVAEGSRR